MRPTHFALSIMTAGLTLLVLAVVAAGCPSPSKQAADNTASQASTAPPANGEKPATPAPASPLSAKVLTPPYLTISAVVIPAGAKLITGQTVTAYWELPQALSATAWVGLVPTATPPTSQESRAAALVSEDLAGRTKAMLPYQIMHPGIYVWRMFESNAPESKPYLESEVFEVIQAPASAKPGQ